MLSLLLYGRNDSHGYNLHKRAAISLNAIAEVLTDPSDEIIFVDYNSPDEVPTFLEVIADTLTDRAKEFIRIIRVRQSFHRRYADKTSLVALESQSRNIAARRANPANRWLLATNTDMVFVPSAPGASLTSICADLADGFYHLPRFELPEGFWERADRRDPHGMIAAMREYGRRYHLNEIVYGGFDNVYEAPGDFQLFLRQDLFSIGGFDETMIKGWHVDTNTARRMKLLRGKVDTAFPLLSGYHCGHTRQATSLHSARGTSNSLDTYARDVKTPFWTTEDSWGAPEETFEEIRLTKPLTPHYFHALDVAVPAGGKDFTEAYYREETFCEEGFDAAHVLPHLADIVFNLPPKTSIFVIGSDAGLVSGFTKFASCDPINARVMLCYDASCGGGLGLDGDARVESVDRETGLQTADVLLLQFPNVRTVPKDQRRTLEWFAQASLERFIAIERLRPREQRRRVIVINGLHNRMQNTIADAVNASVSPFSARIRQGFVFDSSWTIHPDAASQIHEKAIYKSLGRMRGFAPAERESLMRVLKPDADLSAEGWERLALEVNALAEHPQVAEAAFKTTAEILTNRAELARLAIAESASRCATPPVNLPPRADVASRLCSASDWEDQEWADVAIRYFGESAYSTSARTRWLWERVSFIRQLRNHVPTEGRPWILLVCDQPDILAALIAYQGYRVAYALADNLASGEAHTDWHDAIRRDNISLPDEIVPIERVPADVNFRAFISPSACLFWQDDEKPARVLNAVRSRLVPGAYVGVTALVHINSAEYGGALSLSAFETAFQEGGLLASLGLEADAPVDARIPLDTAVRFAYEDRTNDYAPGLSFGYSPSAFLTLGLLSGRTHGTSVRPLEAMQHSQPKEAEAPVSVVAVPPTHQAEHEGRGLIASASKLSPRILSYPTIHSVLRRNALPYIASEDITERNALGALLKSGARDSVLFAIPLSCPSPDVYTTSISTAPTLELSQLSVAFVTEGHAVPVEMTMTRDIVELKFRCAAACTGLLVVEAQTTTLDLRLVTTTRGPSTPALSTQ